MITVTRQFFVGLLFACIIVSTGHGQAAPVILVMGDSLSAGYGLLSGQSWVDLLRERLRREGYSHEVVNASISGETTAGGKTRIDAALKKFKPAIVIIELGGNDGLRGSRIDTIRANLEYMMSRAKQSKASVLLAGMRLPPNYGKSYTDQFAALYSDIARKHKIVLIPFLLEGFAEDTSAFQPDRVHPTAATQEKILTTVWPHLRPLLSAGHGS